MRAELLKLCVRCGIPLSCLLAFSSGCSDSDTPVAGGIAANPQEEVLRMRGDVRLEQPGEPEVPPTPSGADGVLLPPPPLVGGVPLPPKQK